MKKKAYHLTESRKQQIVGRLSAALQEQKELSFAYLFGSFIEDQPIHDIDVGVYLSGAQGIPAFRYALDLSDLLSALLRMPVEITVLNGAPPAFLYHVIKGSLILERDEETRTQVVEDTVRRYLDQKPLLRRSIREAFAT